MQSHYCFLWYLSLTLCILGSSLGSWPGRPALQLSTTQGWCIESAFGPTCSSAAAAATCSLGQWCPGLGGSNQATEKATVRSASQVAHDKFTYFKGHLYPLKRRSLLAEYSIQKFGTISRKGDRHQIFRGLTGRISLKRGRANPLLAEELGAKPPLCSGACASLPPNLP